MLTILLEPNPRRRSTPYIPSKLYLGCSNRRCQICRVDFVEGDNICECTASADKIEDLISRSTKFKSKGNGCCPQCNWRRKKQRTLQVVHRECLARINENFDTDVTRMVGAINELNRLYLAGREDYRQDDPQKGLYELGLKPNSLLNSIVGLPTELRLQIIEFHVERGLLGCDEKSNRD